ncbi:MAG: hypothetical protein QF738_11820 [Rhodospirillales bacterium]|jgi:hypothetical protein|nr:hypothetical protein [Rhodospirillales bacterium]
MGARGPAVVMQPDDGPPQWQPMPANGFARLKLRPAPARFPRPDDVCALADRLGLKGTA